MNFSPKRYLAMDTETTGLEQDHEIIQLGAVFVEIYFDEETERFEWKELGKFLSMVRPQFTNNISQESLRVNGLKKKDILEAPRSQQVRADFFEWWETLTQDVETPLGQNYSGFDKGLLKDFLGPVYDSFFDYHAVDTWSDCKLLQDMGLIPEDLSLSLSSTSKFFGFERLDHSALADSYSSIDVRVASMNLLLDWKNNCQKS